MISKLLKANLTAWLFCCTMLTASAQSKPNPITTAVPFLRIAADARTGAMGDIGLATTADAGSIFVNGAKTSFNSAEYGMGVTYSPYLKDLDLKSLYLLSASGFYKLNPNEAVSIGFRYFSKGDLTFTDNLGNNTKNFRPTDMAVEAGYSRKLSEKLGLGLNLRYINSRLADNSAASDYKSGSAVSADLSMYYMTTKGWSFGAAFTNLGSKISYGSSGEKSYIPANIGLGAAYTKEINDENKISFGLDLNKLLVPTPPDPANASKVASYNNKSVIGSWFSSYGDAPGGFKEEIQEVQVGIGAEYRYINREYLKNQFFLRAGYFMESKFKGDRNYVTAGVGVKRNMLGLNFSYLATTGSSANNVNALNNTLRFSLLCDFKN